MSCSSALREFLEKISDMSIESELGNQILNEQWTMQKLIEEKGDAMKERVQREVKKNEALQESIKQLQQCNNEQQEIYLA